MWIYKNPQGLQLLNDVCLNNNEDINIWQGT